MEWFALLTQYSTARQVIDRYGGVALFIGEMAVQPVAHEDDAERGVRAAPEPVDAVQGLGSGPAPGKDR